MIEWNMPSTGWYGRLGEKDRPNLEKRVINDQWLNDLRFVDDIVLLSDNVSELQDMAEELSSEVGKWNCQ